MNPFKGRSRDSLTEGQSGGVHSFLHSRRSLIGFFTSLAGLAVTPSALARTAAAISFRLHDHVTHTRVVLELSDGVGFSVFQLTQPFRTVIDLPEIDWALLDLGDASKGGLVKELRYGLFQPGQSRVVLDLGRPANVNRAFALPPTATTPWRLVIDLKPVSETAFIGQAGSSKRILIARADGSLGQPRTLEVPVLNTAGRSRAQAKNKTVRPEARYCY